MDMKRIQRYALVGVVNTLFYGFLLYMAISYLNLPRTVAIAISFVMSMLFQYSANRIFTFNSFNRVYSEMPRYLLAALFNYLLTLALFMLLLDYLAFNTLAASLITSLTVATSSYLLALVWVYKVRT